MHVKPPCFYFSFYHRRLITRNMSQTVFTTKFNPIIGKNEWTLQPENYDYIQEIARSSYADMLHDTERNKKYFLAIKKAIQYVKGAGKKAKVLDIGTGTGLLSMMAAQSGADSVIACEAFKVVGECAKAVVKDNGFNIKIIPKRSSELTVGVNGDLQEKANILVTEVFDTELIGEGALFTFQHALSQLLEKDCIVIPSSATMYAQIAESHLISSWNMFHALQVNEHDSIIPPIEAQRCPGNGSVHDLQLANLSPNDFHLLTNALPIFQFDFTGKIPLKINDVSTTRTIAQKSGSCDVVFMWWDLKMDMDGSIILSCAPPWAHPEPSKMQWRDHWMQAIYYLPHAMKIYKEDQFYLKSCHDEYSLWFSLVKSDKSNQEVLKPFCSCGIHAGNSYARIGMLNDSSRNKKYFEILKKLVTPNSVCLSISDGSLLPLIAAKLGAKKVFALETEPLKQRSLKSYIKANGMCNTITIISQEPDNLVSSHLENEKVDILLAEPYFSMCLLPWDNLYFWYVRSKLDPLLNPLVKVVPQKATLMAMPVFFDNLWKIRAPVVDAEGFKLTAFDDMVQAAITLSDDIVEPHHLWEYNCKPLSLPFELLSFDFFRVMEMKNLETSGKRNLLCDGVCNGIALWINYVTEDVEITTGPVTPVKLGNTVNWYKYCQQGVYFIQPSAAIHPLNSELNFNVVFETSTGSFNFRFSVENK